MPQVVIGNRARSVAAPNPVPRTGRVMRRPQHNFYVRVRPFQIQPIVLAPVLAGETMKNLLLQARVVTDPIKNPLIGWWHEYYFFYVKLTDIDEYNGQENTENSALVSMLLNNPSFAKTANAVYSETALASMYRRAGAVGAGSLGFTRYCLKKVVLDWFRPEQETDITAAGLLNSEPVAAINHTSWLDSLTLASAIVRPDVNVDINANATITASEVEEALRRWQWARSTGLTDMTYEDYLDSFGVKTQVEHVVGRSELIRYVREWTYPTNTVEPTTGVPASACSWSIQERADKDRFFKEPGFIFGVTCTRPKVYLKNLSGALGNELDRALDWLPAHLRADAWSALKQYTASTGPASGVTADYWIDIRDLFMYGDQYTDDLSATDRNYVSLPSAAGGKRYPTTADVSALFKTATTAEFVRQDGVCSLSILGTQQDYTGTT